MVGLRQKFDVPVLGDLRARISEALGSARSSVRPGMRIAVGVGSRGISNLSTIVRDTVEFLRSAGADPFIVPAMGSHGGATEEGQVGLLADYGVSEENLKVAVRASLEVERLGTTPGGFPVFFSREALRADGIVLINRVKPHTDFKGEIGSGLLKMMVVGLGKRAGAANYHSLASKLGYEQVLKDSARIILEKAPVLFGVAIVENQVHGTARLEVFGRKRIEEGEAELFVEAKRLLPGLPLQEIDLLIVDRLGKNISGAGMDPNVIGRGVHGYVSGQKVSEGEPVIRRLFVRRLTPESHGNAIGIGMADFTTTRLVREVNREITTINALTALSLQSAKIPIHFDTDREVVERALTSLGYADGRDARVMRIRDTLSLERVEVSEALAEEARADSNLELLGEGDEMRFDETGNLP